MSDTEASEVPVEGEEAPQTEEESSGSGKKKNKCCDDFGQCMGSDFVCLIVASMLIISWLCVLIMVLVFHSDVPKTYIIILCVFAAVFMILGAFGIAGAAKCWYWWPGTWVFLFGIYTNFLAVLWIHLMVICNKDRPSEKDLEDDCDQDDADDRRHCREYKEDSYHFSKLFQNDDGDLAWIFFAMFALLIILSVFGCVCVTLYFSYTLKKRHRSDPRLEACCRSCMCYNKGSKPPKDRGGADADAEPDDEETVDDTDGDEAAAAPAEP